jgi:hypothetical protein
MSTTPRDERRLYARARVVATATVWVRGLCKGSYIVENLSWGGTYLSGGPAVREGDEVKSTPGPATGSICSRSSPMRSPPSGASSCPSPALTRSATSASCARNAVLSKPWDREALAHTLPARV